MDLLAPKITAMRQERERLQKELKATEQQSLPEMGDAEISAFAQRLEKLCDELETKNPARLREIVGRIELWFDRKPVGKRVTYPFSKGVIELSSDSIFSRVVSRDDRRPLELFLAGLEGWNAALRRHFHRENKSD